MEKRFHMKIEEELFEIIRTASFEKRISIAEWMRIAAEEKIERDSLKTKTEKGVKGHGKHLPKK